MPAVDTTWIKEGKLGVTNVQTIKNVQDSALAIVGGSEAIQFKRLEYGSEFEPFAQFKDSIRDAFINFYSYHEDKNLQKIVDSAVYEGYLSEVFDTLAEKAIASLKDGSAYSDTLKAHLLSEHSELSEEMLKKEPKTKTGAKAPKKTVDVESLGVDLDDL